VEVVTPDLGVILADHARRYPLMLVADLYKLLHQAALGSAHAVRDEQAAFDSLQREVSAMGAGPADPLMDPLSPDGQILRVHLRPYMQAGKNLETLLQAFIRTAAEWQGSIIRLKEYGAIAARVPESWTGAIQKKEIEAYFATQESQGFPCVHHSKEYEKLYRPAYRVVARQFLEAG
jgi:hypothetical protein